MKFILKISLLILTAIVFVVILLFGYRDIPLETLKRKYGRAPSSFIAIDGMNVHYREEGSPILDSIPIVLIHGTGSSLHTFNGWVAQLKDSYRVLRMDLPAYGLTGPFKNGNYSIQSYVTFIHKFLSAKGVDKCILGGNSLGGGISWNFALDYPDMVHKLILIDASGYPIKAQSTPLAFTIAQTPILNKLFTFITPRFIARKSVENVYADKSKVSESLVDRYFQLTLRKGNRQAFIDKLIAPKGQSRSKEINRITKKTLVLWGEEDALIPLEAAYKFNAHLPNDTLIILKGLGHVPMEENPEKSIVPLLSFLQEDDSLYQQ
jgi:pimeloyl-ACP methyl ester carboxylesterase